jgi:hypothetical protein
MNAALRTRFRHSILEQLAAASEMGLPPSTITAGCKYAGVPAADEDQVEAECEGYLMREGFLTLGNGAEIHKANKRYRITAAGRGYLAAQGLA